MPAVVVGVSCLTHCVRSRAESASTVEQDTSRWPATFNIGRDATETEIAAWDIDVSPSGEGLPPGSGTVNVGRTLFAAKCSNCHGLTGAEGPFDKLVTSAAGDTTVKGPSAKTIGNYWPYATTVYDYIHRAMPLTAPGSLTPDEVYSITAYLLFANGIIDSTITIDARSLPHVQMPARDRFVPDDRTGGAEVR